MNTISTFEAKTHLSSILAEVEKGDQFIITKHGHPIAKLIPINHVEALNAKDVIHKLKELRRHHTLGGLDWKTLRDTGRR
jgi:prevent-host-death family protein